MPHVLMICRIKTIILRCYNGDLRSHVMGEINAMPINVGASKNATISSKNANVECALQKVMNVM